MLESLSSFTVSGRMSTSTEMKPSEASEIAFSCPICMENYSAVRYPIVAPECGHSICVDCGNHRDNSSCVSCGTNSTYAKWNQEFRNSCITAEKMSSRMWKKNFALLDIIEQYGQKLQTEKRMGEEMEELKKKMEEIYPNDIDYMECSNCHTKEKRERMKICRSCAEKWNKEWKGMKEEEILPFIVCGSCGIDDHCGHTIVKYLPWKLKKLLTTTVSDGKSTVFSMDEICAHEIEKGKEQLGKWNEKMSSFGFIECKTYRDGLSIVDSLKKESDLVCRASEDTLPTLRMYTKVVKDSISRLDYLKEDEVKK